MINKDELLQNYNYTIPQELIAQRPAEKRENSKLIVLNRKEKTIKHYYFNDISDILNENDCLVINTTKVVPARLYGRKKTGGKVEILFLNPAVSGNKHSVLMKPYVKSGEKIYFEHGYECIVSKTEDKSYETVIFNTGDITSLLEKNGFMPLPPYIKRKSSLCTQTAAFDRERYQTVYASQKGAIAAPTAGLHFTKDIIEKLKNKKVEIAEVLLHVGWGTFKTIRKDNISQHQMLDEEYSIDKYNAEKINASLALNKNIIAVGTTTVRALETIAATGQCNGSRIAKIKESRGRTNIFIYPGYEFKIVKSMLTNLHLPCSTPLIMASAFAGREFILKAYKEAVEKKYRFFSYGDSMFII